MNHKTSIPTISILPVPGKSRLLNFLIKAVLVGLLIWVIYRQIFTRDQAADIWRLFVEQIQQQPLYILLIPAALMPINWALESLKWQALVRIFEPQSFRRAYQTVLAGVTFSLFTPNRIGEYGGRILFVRAENNWRAVVATLVGSYAQLLALLGIGVLGLTYFAGFYFDLEPLVIRSFLFIGLTLLGFMLFCYFNIRLVLPVIRRLPYIRRFAQSAEVLRNYDNKTLGRVLGWAVARYFVYSLQYYFLLHYFGIEVDLMSGLSGIATIFLLQTSIPLPPVMGLIARGELALLIWGNFSDQELGMLAATFVLWILNLIVPALVGTVFISNINVLKTLGYEKKSS